MIKFYGARLAVAFLERQAHRHAHEKCLRQLTARIGNMQEISVIQGLQTKIAKLQIAAGIQLFGQARQIKLRQLFIKQPGIIPRLMKAGKYSA